MKNWSPLNRSCSRHLWGARQTENDKHVMSIRRNGGARVRSRLRGTSSSSRRMPQIETWANTYLTLHWRLREFSLRPITIDFVDYVSKCKWASLHLDHLEIQDKDVAIGGVRLDKLESHVFRRSLGITHERPTAFNLVAGIRAYLFRSDCRYLSLTPTVREVPTRDACQCDSRPDYAILKSSGETRNWGRVRSRIPPGRRGPSR